MNEKLSYFGALEYARNELSEQIPTRFFDNKPNYSMEDIIDKCWDESDRLYKMNPTPGGKLEDVLQSGLDGYLPYCNIPDGRTSLFNTLGYNSEVHEYNLWILLEFLMNDGVGGLDFLNTIPSKERVNELIY